MKPLKPYQGPNGLPSVFYVVSDTHFYHDNIVKYSGRDRQIESLTECGQPVLDHNEYMVEKWNSVISDDDAILHLGDLFCWFGGGVEKFEANILPRLSGDKYLIIGNHDKGSRKEYERMGFKIVCPFTRKLKGRKVSFDHYPWAYDESYFPNEIRIHGHIHNNGYPITKNWREGSVPNRLGQINVSVEMIEYTPVLVTDLLLRSRA